MKREATAVVASALVVFGQAAPLLARPRGGGRGSVSAHRAGSYSQLGHTRLLAGTACAAARAR